MRTLLGIIAAAWTGLAPAAEDVSRTVGSFDRAGLSSPGAADLVRKHGSLRPGGQPVTGWLEFDLEVPAAGWHEFLSEPDCGQAEFTIDGRLSLYGHMLRKSGNEPEGKVDNVWLAKGRHTIRIERNIWWGMNGDLRKIILRPSGTEVSKRLRVEYPQGNGEIVLRKGEEFKVVVHGSGASAPVAVEAFLDEAGTERAVSSARAELPAGEVPVERRLKLPCPKEGVFTVSFRADGKPLSRRDVRPAWVRVIDAAPVARTGGEMRKTLLSEIDCAAREPDFADGGPTRVVSKPFGRYRESGDVGFLFAQHHNVEGSWFAYRLAVPEAGRPCVLEADYPDDDYRIFLVTIRDRAPGAYPVAGGVDSGGCFSLTNSMQTHSILFWPRSTDLRVLFMAPHNGWRAAASKVRLYRVEGEIPLLDVPVRGGRTFANWYEEGSNFAGFYGGLEGGSGGLPPAVDLWPRAFGHMGGNLIFPTVSIYQMNLYPSRYNNRFADSASSDLVRPLLLSCEKYGTKFLAEFHPEGRELDPPSGVKENALVSKSGERSSAATNHPKHHPLHPATREWTLGMLGEFADRYKDSPALAGVSLRLMSWTNPSLNNFDSLDWGYDDFTVELFEKETGTKVPVPSGAPDRFARRHAWLQEKARERWIGWRSDKVADLFRAFAARLRAARPDLQLYATLFDLGPEAGIDPAKLRKIEGVVLVNAGHSYGRRKFTYDGPLADAVERDRLLDPALLAAGMTSFLFGSGYFEATEKVAAPEKLGYPADTKKTWTSGVVNPSGRHFLERYAIALAESDALFLADGGNAYTLGQPVLREFMKEFRNLPPVPFRPRPDARDPVAVWELAREDDFLFYAVNRERFPVEVALDLDARGPVRRLSAGQPAEAALKLEPYQLAAFTAPKGSSIRGVKVTVPPAAAALVKSQVDFLLNLKADAEAGRLEVEPAGKKRLAEAAGEAERCLREGRVWRARTLMEHSSLVREVYQKTERYPPGLEFLDGLPPGQRVIPKDPGKPDVLVSFETLESGRLAVASAVPLQAKAEGGCALEPGLRGKAISLDGKTGRVVVEGDGLGALGRNGLTLSAWIRPQKATDRRGIVQRQQWPKGWALIHWNGSLLFEACSQARQTSCRTPDGLVADDRWQHVAVTVEPGSKLTIYRDGARVKDEIAAHPVEDAAAPLLIGWNGWGGRQNDSTPGFFRGLVDEVKVWGRPLTREEVVGDFKAR